VNALGHRERTVALKSTAVPTIGRGVRGRNALTSSERGAALGRKLIADQVELRKPGHHVVVHVTFVVALVIVAALGNGNDTVILTDTVDAHVLKRAIRTRRSHSTSCRVRELWTPRFARRGRGA